MRRLTQLMLSTLALVAAGGSWAQSLQEIYEAARAYDATYLAARAQVDSVQYRTAQSYALRRPSVSANGTARRIETNPASTLNNPSGDRFSRQLHAKPVAANSLPVTVQEALEVTWESEEVEPQAA